jgi:hypothetical protein
MKEISQSNNRLLEMVERAGPILAVHPLVSSSWVCKSLLQKSVRRGLLIPAYRAALTLLQSDPRTLFSRLCVIAFEDVGFGDINSVGLAVAATEAKVRAQTAPDWLVAAALISHLCNAPKCRATDDLASIAAFHPSLERQRTSFAELPQESLHDIVLSDQPIAERALALWYAVGNSRYHFRHLRDRKASPPRLLEAIRAGGLGPSTRGLAELGWRRTREVICLLLPLVEAEFKRTTDYCDVQIQLPEGELINEVPCWAYDGFVREGRAALAGFLNRPIDTSRWIKANVPKAGQMHVLASLLFRIEGGEVTLRRCWPLADHLRSQADLECHGFGTGPVRHVLEMLRQDLSILNAERRRYVVLHGR